MLTRETIQQYTVLSLVDDVTIFPKISKKKARNAIKSYANNLIKRNDLLLLIDNTILRSGKQGMFITKEELFAFSSYSGKFNISLSDIKTLRPEVKSILRVPVCGIYVNEDYFISLPGLGKEIHHQDIRTTGIEILDYTLKSLLNLIQ